MTRDHDLWLRGLGAAALVLNLTLSGYFRRQARVESETIRRRTGRLLPSWSSLTQ